MRNGLLAVVAIAAIGCSGIAPQKAVSGEPKSPVEGFDIHVQAPHMMADGTPGGPFHHYCKGVSDKILQCLLFDSTDPKAKLVAIEYFVAKDLTRKLPAIQWQGISIIIKSRSPLAASKSLICPPIRQPRWQKLQQGQTV